MKGHSRHKCLKALVSKTECRRSNPEGIGDTLLASNEDEQATRFGDAADEDAADGENDILLLQKLMDEKASEEIVSDVGEDDPSGNTSRYYTESSRDSAVLSAVHHHQYIIKSDRLDVLQSELVENVGKSESVFSNCETVSETATTKTKRKRYEWMTSDDEDISSSSDEEEDLVQNSVSSSTLCSTQSDGSFSELPITVPPGQPPPPPGRPPPICALGPFRPPVYPCMNIVSNNCVDSDVSSPGGCYMDMRNRFNPIICGLDPNENEQFLDVTCISVSNISWDVHLNDLKKFIETYDFNPKLSVTKVVKHPQSFPVSNSHQPINRNASNCTVTLFNKTDHTGRAFVELHSYEAVLVALQLNEVCFMGRPLKVIKAYKRGNDYFCLDTAAHYRYYYQQQATTIDRTRVDKKYKKPARVDGGYNWGR